MAERGEPSLGNEVLIAHISRASMLPGRAYPISIFIHFDPFSGESSGPAPRERGDADDNLPIGSLGARIKYGT